jgi:hypothetical protein
MWERLHISELFEHAEDSDIRIEGDMDAIKYLKPKVRRKKTDILGDTSRVITRLHIPDGAH